ncbi:MAG: nucleotidyltransferase family protein [Bacteroidetes bacterium]|nr:nucleotidyltransferase family protein [Rhodothermia bacterium]MCS7154458.1 nucleotidyltransferase family protein [Bacteroidota bacterium]MCX7906831.1 nucleotidyltransferase family protein [Bacteroidota bacterium]MDW8136890.1 nucleotidyltransferase family protein [Bacteroidota bacterium]MDW8285240.1 nucleotidyltransferase family protein [Bacteroidota bacterium]
MRDELSAIVLAGGLGTRLRSVLGGRPKVLAPIAGRPFLDYLLRHLRAQGVRRVFLSTGFGAEQLEAFVGDGSAWGLSLTSIRDPEPLGTGGAIAHVFSRIPDLRRSFVLNGDTFFTGSLRRLLEEHLDRPDAQATIALVRSEQTDRYGSVRINAQDHRVEAFIEKASAIGPAWINAGVYVLERSFAARIAESGPCSLEWDVFPRWVGRGLYGVPFPEAAFLDIGTPEDYARAEAFLKSWSVDAHGI